jgi:peptide/nickel transport system substrate-binding protein
LYADAAAMDITFQPLPRHILEEPFQRLDAQAFASLSFWGRDYVGLGPYRLDDWTPGTSIDASAFDRHALGRPKIDRIRVLLVDDANTAMAMMLSGDAHFANELVFFYEEAASLEQQWRARGGPSVGTVAYAPALQRPTVFQLRPEFANPPALLDVRVRRAIAHGMDAPSAVEVTTGGKGIIAFSLTSPLAQYYPVVERMLEKHAYDPRATQQQLEAAGLVKGEEGFYFMANGDPFWVEVATDGGATNERENAIYVDSLRRAGVNASGRVIPIAQIRDPRTRAAFPGLQTAGIGTKSVTQMTSAGIPRSENRWAGNNRGAWSNVEYDRLAEAMRRAVDRDERVGQIAQMEQILSEDTALIPNLFTPVAIAFVAGLRGPVVRMTPDASWGPLRVHTWEWSAG